MKPKQKCVPIRKRVAGSVNEEELEEISSCKVLLVAFLHFVRLALCTYFKRAEEDGASFLKPYRGDKSIQANNEESKEERNSMNTPQLK